MMMRKLLILLALFMLATTTSAQNQAIGVYFHNYSGVWTNEAGEWFDGGRGLTVEYEHSLRKIQLTAALESRSINWGSEISLLTGIKHNYLDKEKYQIRGSANVGFGLALFRPRPLFQLSIGYIPEFRWKLGKGNNLSFGLGFRYTVCPAYHNYSQIFQVMEIPLILGWSKTFGKVESYPGE